MPEVPARFPAAPIDANLFRAACDPHRRSLLEALVGGPATVTELSRRLGASRQVTAYHAGVLAEAGLLEMRGRWAAARPAPLRILSGYFDQALVGAARASAQIAVQESGLGATDFSKKSPS